MYKPEQPNLRSLAAQAIHKKHGIPYSHAKKIIDSQYKFVEYVMEKRTLKNVLLPKFGTFEVRHTLVKRQYNQHVKKARRINLYKKTTKKGSR